MNFEWSVARISSVRYDESVEERLDGSVKAIGHGPLLQHPATSGSIHHGMQQKINGIM